jgi:hypothetical protein
MPNFANCENCGARINLLDLGKVLYHGFGNCMDPQAHQKEIPFTVRRAGDPVEYLRGEVPVYLN